MHALWHLQLHCLLSPSFDLKHQSTIPGTAYFSFHNNCPWFLHQTNLSINAKKTHSSLQAFIFCYAETSTAFSSFMQLPCHDEVESLNVKFSFPFARMTIVIICQHYNPSMHNLMALCDKLSAFKKQLLFLKACEMLFLWLFYIMDWWIYYRILLNKVCNFVWMIVSGN